MSLRELMREHDEAWEAFTEISGEERIAAFDAGYAGDAPACVLHRKLAEINQRIVEHPEHRNFETDFREAFPDPDEAKAIELWSALANIEWEHEHGSRYSASFRYAGGLVAEMRKESGPMVYMNWYCSGPYATVSDEIAEALVARGWTYKELQ